MAELESEQPLFDAAEWQSFLDKWNDEEPGVLADLLEEFLRESDKHFQSIQAALCAGDGRRLEFAAHTLKSSCSSLGARRLESILRSLVELARARRADEAVNQLSPLIGALRATRDVLLAEIQRRRDPQPVDS